MTKALELKASETPESGRDGELALSQSAAALEIHRAPDVVLAEAQRAAAALKDVISRKARPVKFNGEQYLEFEDWQTVARFYGLTARVLSTQYVQFGGAQGFEAKAEALSVSTGQVLTAAESMCLDDEPTWRRKPLFQLRSMAQTRACAKALRNILSWVVVLAGYRTTPAEEIEDAPGFDRVDQRRAAAPAQPDALAKPWTTFAGMIEEFAKLHARLGALNDSVYYEVLKAYGVAHSNQFKDPKAAAAAYHELLDRVAAIEEARAIAEEGAGS